jgi:hypothetical protein
VKVTTFEGTLEEYQAFLAAQRGFGGEGKVVTTTDYDLPGFIQAVLTRIEMPEAQLSLYRALSAAREGLSRDELATQMKLSDASMVSGVLGALGRRINLTPRSKEIIDAMKVGTGISIFMDTKKIDGRWHYRLRPEVHQVLRDQRIV